MAAGGAGSDGRTARRPRAAPKLRCDSGGGEGPVAGPQSPPAPACDFSRHARPRRPGRRPVLPTAEGWTARRGPAAAGSRLGTSRTRQEGISGNKPAGKRCRSELRTHSLPGPHSLPAPVAAPDRAQRRALADRPAGNPAGLKSLSGRRSGRPEIALLQHEAGGALSSRRTARRERTGGPDLRPDETGRVSAGRPAPLPLQTHGPRAGLDVTVQSQHHRAGPG